MIGVPDEESGEVVVAYVQPRSGSTVDPSALEALCARSLTGYKRPTTFFVVEAIPTNPVGKIDEPSLRAGHAALSARS
ncbi:AMP-binding enzyme [Streptomyces sp. QTS52]